MDLLNKLSHKRSTKVLVDDTIYSIGVDGIVRNVKPEHAKQLLANTDKSWTVLRTAATAPVPEEAPAPVEVAPQEQPVEQPPQAEGAPEADAPVVLAPPPPVDAEPAGVPVSPHAPGEKPDAGEWPEPNASMSIQYLRQMADAYEVKYQKKTTAEQLCKMIIKAMYGDEKGA